MIYPCLNESLCKLVKWYRVPVLSHHWWISVFHAEQAVIIQLTSKSSHSGIAQETFWDIWNRSESVVIKPSTGNLSCCLLKQASFLLFPLFCASLLNCSTALVRGPQALSYKYSLPLRPSFLKLHQGMHRIDQGVNKYVIPFTRRTPIPSTPPSPRTNTVYIRVYLKRRQRRVYRKSVSRRSSFPWRHWKSDRSCNWQPRGGFRHWWCKEDSWYQQAQ